MRSQDDRRAPVRDDPMVGDELAQGRGGLSADVVWKPQPDAAKLIARYVDAFFRLSPFLSRLRTRLLDDAGVRLSDLLDCISLARDSNREKELREVGFVSVDCPAPFKADAPDADSRHYVHPLGLFPRFRFVDTDAAVVTLRVDSVVDFLLAHGIGVPVSGALGAPVRRATVSRHPEVEVEVVEGLRAAVFDERSDCVVEVSRHLERLLLRERRFDSFAEGFGYTENLIDSVVADIGSDWASDLFFQAERRYWQSRNHAARTQKARQDAVGIGWANHDHHTYRSSREAFAGLVSLMERLGLQCRERFYGGAAAGWGAQVMQHPATGVIVFADVDMTVDEVQGDFAHQGLSAIGKLGTVGLWCDLHGEAIFEAGMHHLECQFDFEAVRSQLRDAGVNCMSPFTDLPHLRQAFTEGERWAVDPHRLARMRQTGRISSSQARQFEVEGGLGSHLEILERNDGYQGFNQSGISEIIRETDPRRQRVDNEN